jgi:hypothetical protein
MSRRWRDKAIPIWTWYETASPVGALIFIAVSGDRAMPEIRENSPVVTQITTVKLQPETQNEVLDLMTERARFMATQPGLAAAATAAMS